MSSPPRVLTREQLYELVWTTPMAKLSKEFGLSDVGLAKTCKRFEIPRPPRGYWAKLEAGQKPRRLMLREPLGELPSTIAIAAQSRIADSALHPNDDEGSDALPPISVPEQLTSPHPLIKLAGVQLRAAKADSSGLVSTDWTTAPSIAVARESITRALILFDTLIKAWLERGGTVRSWQPGADNTKANYFFKGGESGSVRLYELTEFVKDPKLLRNTKEYFGRPRRPTGRLAFETDRHHWVPLRSIWKDGIKQRIEDKVASLILGIEAHLVQNRIQSLDRACEARQERRMKERQAIANREAEVEAAEREHLAKSLRDWELAVQIRAYLSHINSEIEAKRIKPINPEGFAKWFDWATWYADHVDPLIQAKPKVKPEAAAQNQSLGEMDLTSETRSTLEAIGVQDAEGLLRVTKGTVAQYSPYDYRVMTEVNRVLIGLGYNRI